MENSIKITEKESKGIYNLIDGCIKILKEPENVIEVKDYNQSDVNSLEEIKKHLENNKPNIYGLYIKENNKPWELKYIGQRNSKGIRQRLREHLIYCNEKTGSQLKKTKEARNNENKIGVKLFRIEPEEFRLVFENRAIAILDPQWNKKKDNQ